MKYPFILFYRDDIYKNIDLYLESNADKLLCTIHIINKKEKINNFYKQIYPMLIIYGKTREEYDDDLREFITDPYLSNRIFFFSTIESINEFNTIINNYYINICTMPRTFTRPIFSIFTPSYNSFTKILRAFNSLKAQTFTNWEWIIMDDSPDEKNYNYLKTHLTGDARVRLYRRHENNGYIGNVKNETVSLCRGQYLLELDHDDEILPFVLEESVKLFESKPEVGFIYMDFINIYENGNNFWYGDDICKGYGSYYCQKYNNKWVFVYNSPQINNITLSHLACCPNHPRIWRKETIEKIENFCEYLPICDDYEILLRTAVATKMAKISKMGYIQYMNDSNNNFSLIRNAEINRIGPYFISPIYYESLNIKGEMKKMDAFEDEKHLLHHTNIWKRDDTYSQKYCNLLINNDYSKQFCIIGLDGLIKHMDQIKELYQNVSYDFLILDNKCTIEYLSRKVDDFGFDRMKCYVLVDQPEELLINYFKRCYLSVNEYEIITSNIVKLNYNSDLNQRHLVVNSSTKPTDNYLEIGIEYGYTFSNTHFLKKTGVDPDPKCSNIERATIYNYTSDKYFEMLKDSVSDDSESDKKGIIEKGSFDVVFIDGMHHCEYVLRDFNNSVNILSKTDTNKGIIFIDDILPLNYNEQLKIPFRHYYENGVLKYGEEWTGDVWKFIYHLLLKYSGKVNISYFYNINYRGVIRIEILEKFEVVATDEELNSYDYFENFNNYLDLLSKK